MPHVVQSHTPVGNLSRGNCHNVSARPIERDLCSKSLQGSEALVPGVWECHWRRGKVAVPGECTPPPGAHCQSGPSHAKSWDVTGTWVRQRAEVWVSLSKK